LVRVVLKMWSELSSRSGPSYLKNLYEYMYVVDTNTGFNRTGESVINLLTLQERALLIYWHYMRADYLDLVETYKEFVTTRTTAASQMQVECGQRVGMEGRRLSSGTCIHCHVRCRQSIEDTWMTSTVWTVPTWSVFNQSIRTNNDVEGLLHKLNRKARKGNLQFYLKSINYWSELS
jgi:hypothetical protein